MKSTFGIPKALWPKASALFDQLSELDPGVRAGTLANVRAQDAALADAVEMLLARTPPVQSAPRIPRELSASRATERNGRAFDALLRDALHEPGHQYRSGDRFGAWTLIAPLGRGGMGEVWRAKRSDGLYDGEAAIKLLRTDLPAERLAARFARERSVLARLNHPNIARLLDAGVGGDDGKQAFLVLELVEGVPFETYLRNHAQDARARVALLRDLTNAVGYAHSQLVLHRDIKPSNVLVDRDGRVKLLDFGIAAEIGDEAVEQTTSSLTQLTGRGLTLEYAAPEQVIGEPTSAASDTYSLGALLYYALTGVHPFAEASNRAALNRAVLEQSPIRPRERVAQRNRNQANSANPVEDFAAAIISDDLDAIVSKSLRKSSADRYPTAQSFSADLNAWLAREPISIRADDRAYRWRLWFGRNRAVAIASAVATVAVLIGAATSLVQRNNALEQAAAAERASADALANEKRATTALADLARQVSATEAATQRAVEAQALAEQAKARAEGALAAETRATAATRAALTQAERERRIAVEQTKLAESEQRVSEATSRFVAGLFEAADPERTLGEKLTALAVLDAGSKTLTAGPQIDPKVAASIGTTLGRVFNHLSRPDRAASVLEDALRLATKEHGANSKQAIDARYEYARALERKERFAEAIPLYRELIALPASAPFDVKRRVFSQMELAFSLGKLGKYEEAEAVQRELELFVETLPADEWLRVEVVASRAVLASQRGQWQETNRLYKTVAHRLNSPPPGHARDALLMRLGYATSTLGTGQIELASQLFPPLYAEAERLLGPDANETLQILWTVGFTKRNVWDLQGCIDTYDRAYAGRLRTSGATHALTLDAGLWAAACRAHLGQTAVAREALDRFTPTLLAVADVGRSDLRNFLTASVLAIQVEAFDTADRLLAALDAAATKLNLRQSAEMVRGETLGLLLAHARHRDPAKTLAALEILAASRANTQSAALVRMNFDLMSVRAQLAALARDCEQLRAHAKTARDALVRRSGANHPHIAALDQSAASCEPRVGGMTPAALGIL